MDLKAASSGDMSKKKVFKSTLYGPAGGFFFQKKKVVLGNVKHSGNKKDISLVKLGSGGMYLDMNNESSCGKDNIVMEGVNSRFLLGLIATTSKAKRVNSSMIDSKIVKTPVEVSVRKSFALDINLLAIESKFATAKTHMEVVTLLAKEKGINVNSDLKRQGMRLDWAVVIKKIFMDMPKDMIITAVFKFGKIKSIKIQLIGMWQKAVVEFAELDQANLLASKHHAQTQQCDIGATSFSSLSKVSATLIAVKEDLVLDMVMDDSELVFSLSFSASPSVSLLGLSSSKVLTTKIGSLESKLVALEAFVGSVLAKLDYLGAGLTTCNIQGINVPAKQDDVIHWHKDMGNLISMFTETKLKDKIRLWIADKFEGVCVFTSGLNYGYLGAGIVVIMDSSLAKHVCKVSELSVSVLELYVGASSAARFSQAGKINFLIAKAANRSFFVILGGDFNKDGVKRSASFKKCVSLGLVNSLVGSLVMKIDCNIMNISNYFDTDHQAVFVSVSLSGLLDTQLNFFRRQANKDYWKFDFKGADNAKWSEFKKAMAANAKWFKSYDGIFTKESFKFYKLELLVLKIVKASYKKNSNRFAFLIECWDSLDNVKASIVQKIVNSGLGLDCVCSAFFSVQKAYYAFKLAESI
ncbi:hypothetical protein G9A89_007659 [Geosiphon pyriformis]|nr:hypothetical protein G9A89_007659 [Geosiphon pyriformis]